jgi:3-hydroxy-9,10-secoandrosta-1,3,5(10)-triene-9,17-dione monooxygenase reductase component
VSSGEGGKVDSARYRQVLGYFATGVTVITSMDGDEPVGLAANSFTSLSLEPPLVLFSAAHTSSTWPLIRDSGRFCVNVLSEAQEDVCRRFAEKGADRFKAVGWRASEGGSPILADTLAWIDCVIENRYPGGDHEIVVGRVLDLDVVGDGRPLVFYRGGYGRFEA